MHNALKSAAVVLGLASASFAMAGCAAHVGVGGQGVGVSAGFGDIAYGYNDGYWDRSHQWHQWRDADEMNRYRSAYGDNYHDWRHDRDPDQGWPG